MTDAGRLSVGVATGSSGRISLSLYSIWRLMAS